LLMVSKFGSLYQTMAQLWVILKRLVRRLLVIFMKGSFRKTKDEYEVGLRVGK
jgi:hypothetical protein